VTQKPHKPESLKCGQNPMQPLVFGRIDCTCYIMRIVLKTHKHLPGETTSATGNKNDNTFHM